VYLIDTNVILEVLLEREQADEAEKFLCQMPRGSLFVSEFSLYSLGVFLFRQEKHEVFLKLVEDLFESLAICLVRLTTQDVPALISAAQRYHLDFDDAYQYAVAEKHDLTIVSFDHDFDRTERGRKTPKEVLRASEA
jgi:predicted nucleic acid-binding protein